MGLAGGKRAGDNNGGLRTGSITDHRNAGGVGGIGAQVYANRRCAAGSGVIYRIDVARLDFVGDGLGFGADK